MPPTCLPMLFSCMAGPVKIRRIATLTPQLIPGVPVVQHCYGN